MGIKARYIAVDNWEDVVVNAIANAPGVQSTCQAKAGAIAGSAGRNLLPYLITDNATRMLKEDVMAGIGVKPVDEFVRKKVFRGTIIPVALAICDSWAARWFELGNGRRVPMTRFMRKAVDSNDSAGWTYWTYDGGEG